MAKRNIGARNWFTAHEKQFILDRVTENKDILESKVNDLKTNTEKNKKWTQIAVAFNARYSKNASAKSLNQLYRKLKSTARTEVSKNKIIST